MFAYIYTHINPTQGPKQLSCTPSMVFRHLLRHRSLENLSTIDGGYVTNTTQALLTRKISSMAAFKNGLKSLTFLPLKGVVYISST